MESIKALLKKYLGLIVGAGSGLLVGILFLLIGFFPTMLLIILAGVGAILGGVPSVRKVAAAWLRRVFGRFWPGE